MLKALSTGGVAGQRWEPPGVWVVLPQGTQGGFLSGVEAGAYFSQVNCTSGKKCLVFYKILLK